jgi:glycosyltransferase involved in cell wall biosynthesis
MAYGLPIIATNVFAVPEIVENGKSGIIVEPDLQMYDSNYDYRFRTMKDLSKKAESTVQSGLVERLSAAMAELVEDDKKRRNFGDNGRQRVDKGEFSIGRRNAVLREILEELSRK